MHDPEPYSHWKATAEATVSAGVYRVVGTAADTVTLLCVADANGRRQVTGEVVTVSREQFGIEFESATNPDAGFGLRDVVSPVTTMATALVYWLRRPFT